MHLLPFRGEAPSRRIAMVWRKSSAMTAFLEKFAAIFKQLPHKLFDAKSAASIADTSAAKKSAARGR